MSDVSESAASNPNPVNTEAYDASKLGKLEGLEAVRKKPGMYIGGTGSQGLVHLESGQLGEPWVLEGDGS